MGKEKAPLPSERLGLFRWETKAHFFVPTAANRNSARVKIAPKSR